MEACQVAECSLGMCRTLFIATALENNYRINDNAQDWLKLFYRTCKLAPLRENLSHLCLRDISDVVIFVGTIGR